MCPSLLARRLFSMAQEGVLEARDCVCSPHEPSTTDILSLGLVTGGPLDRHDCPFCGSCRFTPTRIPALPTCGQDGHSERGPGPGQ